MSIRLHINRLVVDQSLAAGVDPRDIRSALQAELGRLVAERGGASQFVSGHEPAVAVPLGRGGTFAERLAGSLHRGILHPSGGERRRP